MAAGDPSSGLIGKGKADPAGRPVTEVMPDPSFHTVFRLPARTAAARRAG